MSLSLSSPISYPSGGAFEIPPLRSGLLDKTKNYLRQALHARIPEPVVPVKQKDWFSVFDKIPKGARVPGLRGLRMTAGIEKILRFVARSSGPHGDRFFMHQRTIALRTGYNVRLVGEALRLGVATGLLIRHTHGAGGSRLPGAYKKQGASFQLAFPGGEEGIAATRDWLDQRFTQGRKLSTDERQRRTRIEEADTRATKFIQANPDLVQKISQRLRQAPDHEGARRVVARVFYRTRKKIHVPRQYILKAVENDVRRGGDLVDLFPPTETKGENHAQAVIAQLLAGLHKPPDW